MTDIKNNWPANTSFFTMLHKQLDSIDEVLYPLLSPSGLPSNSSCQLRRKLHDNTMKMHSYRQLASAARDKLAMAIRQSDMMKAMVWLAVLRTSVSDIYRLTIAILPVTPMAEMFHDIPYTLGVPCNLRVSYLRINEVSRGCLSDIDSFKRGVVEEELYQSAFGFYHSLMELEKANYLVDNDKYIQFVEDYIDVGPGLKSVDQVQHAGRDQRGTELAVTGLAVTGLAAIANQRYQCLSHLLLQSNRQQWRKQVELTLETVDEVQTVYTTLR